MKHYSDNIIEELEKMGWVYDGTRQKLKKLFKGVRPAGQFSNGDRYVTAKFCERYRYLIGSFGWDEFEIDGREYQTAPAEAARVFNMKAGKIVNK